MTESWDEPAPTTAELPEIKLFGKWSSDEVQVSDISLTVSIVLDSPFSLGTLKSFQILDFYNGGTLHNFQKCLLD